MNTLDRKRRDPLHVLVEASGATMPEGFDSWGAKSVLPDLATTRNFRWAMPGGVNVSNDHLVADNRKACPERPGDGLCVATTWRGMASGGIPARTLLLVAYRAADVVGRDDSEGKLRIGGEVVSVALIDGERFIREHGKGLDLRGADLRGMNLRGADLQGADLRGADLHGANLQRANLRGADLQGAHLQGADLWFADLQYADLCGADLWGANIWGAKLRGADLWGAKLRGANLQYAGLQSADLQYADLRGANLQYANLRGANLRGADLRGADPQDARFDGATPPAGWTVATDGLLTREQAQA